MEKEQIITDKRDELDELVKEYNGVEAKRMALLKRLFYVLKKGQGHRKVVFASGEMFSNAWGLPDHMDYKAYLKPLDASVLEVERGAVKTKY